MGYYNTVQEAKSWLMSYGFDIHENVCGDIGYINRHGVILYLKKFSDNSCRIFEM